jgi:hypothetical protein
MDKRRHKRINVDIEAELITGGKSYSGIIENVSKSGICLNSMITGNSISLKLEAALEVRFKTPSGHKLGIPCVIKWMHIHYDKTSGLTNSMGMEIEAPSDEYLDFVTSME